MIFFFFHFTKDICYNLQAFLMIFDKYLLLISQILILSLDGMIVIKCHIFTTLFRQIFKIFSLFRRRPCEKLTDFFYNIMNDMVIVVIIIILLFYYHYYDHRP